MSRKLPYYLDDEKTQKLEQVMDNWKILVEPNFKKLRNKLIYMFGRYCGLRVGEIVCIKKDDINLSKKLLRVRLEGAKNKKEREVPIPDLIIPLLKHYFYFYTRRFKEGYIFPNITAKNKTKHISTKYVRWMFHKYYKAAGLLEIWSYTKSGQPLYKYRTHSLRHSYASQLLKEGVDLNTIKELLGHENIQATQTYLHINSEKKQEAVDRTFNNQTELQAQEIDPELICPFCKKKIHFTIKIE